MAADGCRWLVADGCRWLAADGWPPTTRAKTHTRTQSSALVAKTTAWPQQRSQQFGRSAGGRCAETVPRRCDRLHVRLATPDSVQSIGDQLFRFFPVFAIFCEREHKTHVDTLISLGLEKVAWIRASLSRVIGL